MPTHAPIDATLALLQDAVTDGFIEENPHHPPDVHAVPVSAAHLGAVFLVTPLYRLAHHAAPGERPVLVAAPHARHVPGLGDEAALRDLLALLALPLTPAPVPGPRPRTALQRLLNLFMPGRAVL